MLMREPAQITPWMTEEEMTFWVRETRDVCEHELRLRVLERERERLAEHTG